MMGATGLLVIAAVLLAFANGANDNFKGVATLYGGGTLSYANALALATAATLLGSFYSLYLASGLIQAFHGSGLVPDALAGQARFVLAVGAGAALTVLMATVAGMPISTTHGLLGAMIGAGLAAHAELSWDKLSHSFIGPLVLSPLLAVPLAAAGYYLIEYGRRRFGPADDACICVVGKPAPVVSSFGTLAASAPVLTATIASGAQCSEQFPDAVARVDVSRSLDFVHVLSAGAVSFARGVNDTPKVAALLVVAPLLSVGNGTTLVAVAIAVGAIVGARRVAETMSHEITTLDPSKGLVANLSTAFVVLMVSRWGLPASTTHVSCGALFSVGALSGRARRRAIIGITGAWLATLPVAALIGAATFYLLE